jgi:hypothetical protein
MRVKEKDHPVLVDILTARRNRGANIPHPLPRPNQIAEPAFQIRPIGRLVSVKAPLTDRRRLRWSGEARRAHQTQVAALNGPCASDRLQASPHEVKDGRVVGEDLHPIRSGQPAGRVFTSWASSLEPV